MATPRPIEVDAARDLLTRMEECARQSGEIDVACLSAMLEEALSAPRGPVVFYLAAYLSRCLTGSVPDYRLWIPPGF